ncbi:MAG: exodeoxyribonuclease VII small subunit [Synergistales bacterium]|nr:exodeoxyribonuclease VII small subunit [Synergistales bacterium]
MKFSEKLQKVENIVHKLEKEQIPLEEALSLYEDGISLIRELQTFLQQAEQKVMVLSEDLQEEPFDASEEDN